MLSSSQEVAPNTVVPNLLSVIPKPAMVSDPATHLKKKKKLKYDKVFEWITANEAVFILIFKFENVKQ